MPAIDFLETSAAAIWVKFAGDIDRVERRRRGAVNFVVGSFACVFGFAMLGAPYGDAAGTFWAYTSVAFTIGAACGMLMYKIMRRGQWLVYKTLSALISREIFGAAYKPWGIIDAEEIARHDILPAHSRLYREEGYGMNLHGYHIRFQEIDAVRSAHVDSVREWYEHSVGSGLYVLIKLKRDLPAHTMLFSKGTLRTWLKRLIRKRIDGYEDVGLVSPRFTRSFEVLSSDQIEARVAFHPAFLEKFMEIAGHLGAKDIEASFRGDELLIHARYKHDMFQLGRFFRALREDDIDALVREVRLYAEIVDSLRLNPYTAP